MHRGTMILVGAWAAFIVMCGTAAAQTTPEPSAAPYGTFAFTMSVLLPAPPDAVYDALTGDITEWWDHSFSDKPYRMYIEPKPGGGFYEIFSPDGDGVLHATVTFARRGSMLRFVGPLGLAGSAVELVCTFTFTPAGTDSTRLDLAVHAAGEIRSGLDAIVQSVWNHFLHERFVPYVTTGAYKKKGSHSR